MKLSKRKQTLAKENVKGMFKKQNHLRKQLDTIVYPQTNHTIVYHDHSCFFFAWLKLILWKPLVLIPRKMKLSKRKQTLAKEKETEMVEKKHNLRKQLDTIVCPQTNHTIVYHDHSCFFFAWLKTNPLESLWF